MQSAADSPKRASSSLNASSFDASCVRDPSPLPLAQSGARQAMVCVSLGERPWYQWVRPTHERYAATHNLTYFAVQNLRSCGPLIAIPHRAAAQYCKLFMLRQLLTDFARVVSVDDSYVLATDAPNIFEVVSEGKLGVFQEAKRAGFNFHPSPLQKMGDLQVPIGLVHIEYAFNTGFLVVGQAHKQLLQLPNSTWLRAHLGAFPTDQEYFNYAAFVAKTALQPLSDRWGGHPGMWYWFAGDRATN